MPRKKVVMRINKLKKVSLLQSKRRKRVQNNQLLRKSQNNSRSSSNNLLRNLQNKLLLSQISLKWTSVSVKLLKSGSTQKVTSFTAKK